jgi:hypothetical protein
MTSNEAHVTMYEEEESSLLQQTQEHLHLALVPSALLGQSGGLAIFVCEPLDG